MITYVYETLPKAGKKIRRYEIQQSIKDAALTKHPETGEAIRRCIVPSKVPLFVREATIEVHEPVAKRKKREKMYDDEHGHSHDHHH
jgi:hypothetical protein